MNLYFISDPPQSRPGLFLLYLVLLVPSLTHFSIYGSLHPWTLNDLYRGMFPPDQHYVPLLKAIMAHLYFAWIHPFGDGNGRVARLIEFQTLINSGVPSPAAHLLSSHYNSTRMMHYMQLDKSSQSTDGEFSFLKYALEGFIDGLRDQLTEIKRQQLEVTWGNYIHGVFKKACFFRNRLLI